MTYEQAKRFRDALERQMDAYSAVLNAAPKGQMGLTLDSAKTPEWHAARQGFAQAFQALRRFNTTFVRQFRAEIRAERASRAPVTNGQ